MKPFANRTDNRAVSRSLKQLEPELELELEPEVTALSLSLQTKSYDVEPESENFDEWLVWLDEMCALARRMGIERQIEWHVGQLAELSLRWIEEGAEA